jgi:hypothetical protein
VSVNAYQKSFYAFADNTLNKVDEADFDKKQIVVSTIDAKDFITTIVDVSSAIPEEDVQDSIELKTFEDLGLDQEIEYVIRYVEAKGMATQESRFYHVFVTEADVIFETFLPIRDELKFIDYIFPRPYLIQNVYQRKVLEPVGVQGYLYFQKEDAFIALYQDGEFLYTKSIKYSLENIYERFCELFGERVNEDSFYTMLEEDGLRTSDFEFQDVLMKLFSEVFMHVNDILIYAKRAHNIERIDLFYIGSEFGPILGLNEYAQTYLGIEADNFDFDYDIQHGEWYIDQFQYLSILEVLKEMESEEEAPNFTLFFRPPPFAQRKSGQFILTTFFSVVLALALPIYNYVYDSYTKVAIQLLQKKESELRTITTALRAEITGLEKSKKNYLEKTKKEKEKLQKKKKILMAVYDKKVHYPMKAKKLVAFANDMAPFGVKVARVENIDNNFTLSLVSPSDKKMTEYIRFLTKKYDQTIHADIEKIYKDDNTSLYYGDLKVILR